MEAGSMKPIAHMRADLPAKFALPRQSGLAESLKGEIVFEPDYRDVNALRGLDTFSHIWLLWGFSLIERDAWTPTVRPPRLGGNERVGVFATRSPFRPNSLGLSCVRLESIEYSAPEGPILRVSGADLADHTPIYDIKPYLKYTDCHPEATDGFAGPLTTYALKVNANPSLLGSLPEDKRDALVEILSQDPRPGYRRDDERAYGFPYAGFEVRFRVVGDTLYLLSVEPCGPAPKEDES